MKSFEQRKALVAEAVDMYHLSLVRYLFSMTRQWQDAEDLAQKLWTYVLTYVKEENIQKLSYLRMKAKSIFIDHYRAHQRKPLAVMESPPDMADEKVSQEAFTEEEEIKLKEKFFSKFPGIDLSEDQKEATWLHARYGYTYAEISKMKKIPQSTVGDWIKLARIRMAAYLNGESS